MTYPTQEPSPREEVGEVIEDAYRAVREIEQDSYVFKTRLHPRLPSPGAVAFRVYIDAVRNKLQALERVAASLEGEGK